MRPRRPKCPLYLMGIYLFLGRAGRAFPGEHILMGLVPEDIEKFTAMKHRSMEKNGNGAEFSHKGRLHKNTVSVPKMKY